MLHQVKKIWMFDDASSQGARIIMRSVMDALRKHGYDLHVFEANHRDPTVLERMKADLIAFQPELIFLANHPIHHLLKQLEMETIDCHVIVWLFDDPIIMGEERFQPHETVLAADPSFINGAKQRGAEKVLFVPVAAPCAMDVEEKEEYRHPVVYAGSVFINQNMRNTIDPAIAPVVRHVIQQKLQHPANTFQELLDQTNVKALMNLPKQVDVKIDLSPALIYFIYAECNRHWRLQFLKTLDPCGIHLYGNQSWQPYLQGSGLQQRFHPPIDSFTEYPRLIKSADININIHSLQGITAPTLRDFQVPFYGGFQLSVSYQDHPTNWQEHDPNHLFGLDTFPWSPSASSPEVLRDMVQQYLGKPEARKEWIFHTKECIEHYHTMTHRIGQLIEIVNQSK
jgi:hypothetical protein